MNIMFIILIACHLVINLKTLPINLVGETIIAKDSSFDKLINFYQNIFGVRLF
jgi:hypothetical protein